MLTGDGMSYFDNFFSRLMLVVVVLEFFADQQQWNFHKAKKEYNDTAKPPASYSREELDRGFLTSGLWGWSRHPNFAAEQAFWVALYQWCCCETSTYMNWTFLGAMSYLILFQSSTWFTESISSKKYPDYRVYQKHVGKFLPKWNSLGMDAAVEGATEKDTKGEKVKSPSNGKKKA